MAGAASLQTVSDLCAVLWGLPMQHLSCSRGQLYLHGCKGVEVKDIAAAAVQGGVTGQLE